MKHLYRRLLFIGSVLVFLTAAPLVIYYAIGYRPNVSTTSQLTQAVGALYLESVPRRADIAVNGVSFGRTPRIVQNIVEKTVDVSVTKAGYRPWRKRVPIQPTQVTEIRSIRLIPEHITARPLVGNVATFAVSPNRRLLAAVSADATVQVVTVAGESVLPPLPLPGVPHQLIWSPNSTGLILRLAAGDVRILDIASSRLQSLPTSVARGLVDIQWDPQQPGRLIGLNAQGQVFAYTMASAERQVLHTQIHTFASAPGALYLARGTELLRSTLAGDTAVILVNTDSPIERIFVGSDTATAILLASGRLRALGPDNTLLPVSDSVQTAAWSPDGTMLLVQSEVAALHVFNLDNERVPLPVRQLNLVVRLATPIRDPQWFAGNYHLIYQVNDEIRLTEIDSHDVPVSETIDTTNRGDARLAVGENGDVLFYLKANDSGTDLVATSLIGIE